MSTLLLPNPCLLGIVFTIATHDGNHVVFHYPPKPKKVDINITPLDEDTESDSDEDIDDINSNLKEMEESEDGDDEDGDKLFSFDKGFIADLATPPKQLCNTRFELTVEDTVFLGMPIHINDDGTWRKTTKRRGTIDGHEDDEDEQEVDGEHQQKKSERKREKEVKKDKNLSGRMYQFHMMFVMDPPVVEYNHRIDEMFHYIISRISLLLRYEQQKNGYVWTECEKLLSNDENVTDPTSISSLARLIKDTYDNVIRSEIVNIEINGKTNSFQIPLRKEFPDLPHVPVPERSTLSSISPITNGGDSTLRYFSLILLDNVEDIIRDIRAERDSLIAGFVRMIRPNESLAKLSVLSGLDIAEVQLFATHLVYWRRAVAVLPLSPRNTYVISPLAPMNKIFTDADAFNKTFPNLPSLQTFLAIISDASSKKPKAIGHVIPTKDHRELYMEAISWLLRYGYIIQLCTFAYVKITSQIQMQVAEEMEIEFKKRDVKRVFKFNEEEEDVIILQPQYASSLERRWITKIVEGLPSEIVGLFYRILPHLNGKDPLEIVLLQEKMSRHEWKRLCDALQGVIIIVRHW